MQQDPRQTVVIDPGEGRIFTDGAFDFVWRRFGVLQRVSVNCTPSSSLSFEDNNILLPQIQYLERSPPLEERVRSREMFDSSAAGS